jgi:pyridinium-3,5-bisthiocarboxylic acid mononucleotide nickel chelatase
VSRLLYFDCFAGASGDMMLGALLDAGLPLEALREALGSLAIDGYELRAARVLRSGVSATKFTLIEPEPAPDAAAPAALHAHAHTHAHTHGQGHTHSHGPSHSAHPHRSLREIEGLIASSALSPAGREKAIALFRKLAEAEAAIHDMSVEQVHLHEVGALDSIIDIVGSVFALEWFGADRIVASPLNTGSGTVKCAHGLFPVPAPATARLLTGAPGVPVYANGPSMELLTPTGALLVTGYAGSYGPLPAMSIDRVGYGAGDRDFVGFPNVLRVYVGRTAERPHDERVTVMQCEIDDMNPQLYGVLMDALLAAGALDVFFASVQMKKNRPGTLVTVLSPPERREVLSQIVFRETTTLGLRYHDVLRECLRREQIEVQTPWGPVRVKVARRGDALMNASPEFEDCRRLAAEHQVPVKDVQAAAVRAFAERPSRSE